MALYSFNSVIGIVTPDSQNDYSTFLVSLLELWHYLGLAFAVINSSIRICSNGHESGVLLEGASASLGYSQVLEQKLEMDRGKLNQRIANIWR